LRRAALRHLSLRAVLAIHEHILAADGGATGLRDAPLLESAIAAPQASFGGKPLIKDPVEVAAAYLFYLCRNHPFVDGNKRTALACCLVLLEANNLLPHPAVAAAAVDAWEKLMLDVASARIDRKRTTVRLRTLLRGKKARRR
jgi:death-on-curing protein